MKKSSSYSRDSEEKREYRRRESYKNYQPEKKNEKREMKATEERRSSRHQEYNQREENQREQRKREREVKAEVDEIFRKEENEKKEIQRQIQEEREKNRLLKEKKLKERESLDESSQDSGSSSNFKKRKHLEDDGNFQSPDFLSLKKRKEEKENHETKKQESSEKTLNNTSTIETTNESIATTTTNNSEARKKKVLPPKEEIMDLLSKLSGHIANKKTFLKAVDSVKKILERGLITKQTKDEWFKLLESAMETEKGRENSPELREGYKELFLVASDYQHIFDVQQQAIFQSWCLRAIAINELFTDDSFIFANGIAKIKQTIEQTWDIQENHNLLTRKMQEEQPENTSQQNESRNSNTDPEIVPSVLQNTIIDCMKIAISFTKIAWAKGSIQTLVNLAWAKKSIFRQEQLPQLVEWINKLKGINASTMSNSSGSMDSFKIYERRWEDALKK